MNDSQRMINWYPGHMAKTRRLLLDQIKRVDLIIEVCDARLPYSSRNPDLGTMVRGKKRILLMNKEDLAEPAMNQKWLSFFRREGISAYLCSLTGNKGKELAGIIQKETREITEKALEKGVRKTIRAMVIGVPNVGKSTLINRLYGRNITQIGDRPGVTRSNQWIKVSPYLEVLDTPGLLWPRLDDQLAARRLCYIGSVKDDVIDLAELTIHLLEDLCTVAPERTSERFHLKDTGLRGVELLDAVCAGRGWLLKGAQPDYDRCCSVVLDEYRGGKLGRITLELPPADDGKEPERDD